MDVLTVGNLGFAVQPKSRTDNLSDGESRLVRKWRGDHSQLDAFLALYPVGSKDPFREEFKLDGYRICEEFGPTPGTQNEGTGPVTVEMIYSGGARVTGEDEFTDDVVKTRSSSHNNVVIRSPGIAGIDENLWYRLDYVHPLYTVSYIRQGFISGAPGSTLGDSPGASGTGIATAWNPIIVHATPLTNDEGVKGPVVPPSVFDGSFYDTDAVRHNVEQVRRNGYTRITESWSKILIPK